MLSNQNTVKNKRKKKRRLGPALAPATLSDYCLVRIAPAKVGMFRFLLEAYEHIAYFSVLNKQEALLKIVYSPHRARAAKDALNEIAQSLDMQILPWPASVKYAEKG